MIELGQWLLSKRVIYVYASAGPISLENWYAHNQRLVELLNQGSPPVHIILDSHPKHEIPNKNLKMALDSLTYLRHPALGHVVLTSSSKHPQILESAILGHILRVPLHRVGSTTAAIDYLCQNDPTITWDKIDVTICEGSHNFHPSSNVTPSILQRLLNKLTR